MEILKEDKQSSKNSEEGAQGYANWPLQNQNENIQRVLSKKCKRHPKKKAEFLHLFSNIQNPRICIDCIQQDDILSTNYLQINELLSNERDSSFFGYPVLTDLKILNRIEENKRLLDSYDNLFKPFFKELIQQIQTKIETRRNAKQLKINQLGEIYQNSVVCLAEIMDISNLQAIILEDNEVKLVEFIRNHISNSPINTHKIKEICNQFEAIQKDFSMEQPNKIKNLVSALLDEISFFEGAYPSPLKAIEQRGENQNEFQRLQKQLEDQIIQTKQAQETIQKQLLIIEKLQGAMKKQAYEINDLKQQNYNIRVSQLQEKSNVSLEQILNLQKKASKQLSQLPEENVLPGFQPTDLLSSTELILSNIDNSLQFSIRRNNNNELEFMNNNGFLVFGLAYLNLILDPSANYLLHVKLQQVSGQDKYFFFGLMKDSGKDSTLGPDENLCYSEYDGDSGLNTLIKGNHILADNSFETRSLEVRINIQRTLLRVGSLPDYNSVVEVDNPQLIDPTIPYRFFLYGLNPRSKIVITKFETVEEFNTQM